MAGHSHWAGIKHKKALVDAKRGKLWSKLAKAIIVAAQTGGGDPNMNLRLRYAIDDARAVSMPRDNIERAIKKGTGELSSGRLEEVIYEGYAAGGVAVICEVLTDNRNRTAPEIRKIFELGGGSLGTTNCVAWKFDLRGQFIIAADAISEDALMELMLEAGAEDVVTDGDRRIVTCEVDAYDDLREALKKADIALEDDARRTRIPQMTVDLEASDARKVLRLMERLDDHEDVQSVSADYNIPDEVMAQIEAEES